LVRENLNRLKLFWEVGLEKFEYGLVLSLISVIAITSFHASYGVNVTDSPNYFTTKTYANYTADADCTSLGGNSSDDGVCDNWKVNTSTKHGLYINFTSKGVTYNYSLPCTPGNTIQNDPTGLSVCPQSGKKDVYLELDYMTGQAPNSQSVSDVVAALDKIGIALHVQYGENPNNSTLGDIKNHFCNVAPTALVNNPRTGAAGHACSSTSPYYQSFPFLKQNFFGTISERQNVQSNTCPNNATPSGTSPSYSFNCLTAKRQVFHYVMYVNYQLNNIGSSGWSEYHGNDMIISLGNFTNGAGNIDEGEASLMHELGHNFNLFHGGAQPGTGISESDDNCKPNYPSIMSYTYEFRSSFDECRPLAFSNKTLSYLDETSLHDSNIGSYRYPTDNPVHPPDDPTKTCPHSGQRELFWFMPNSGIHTGYFSTTNDWNGNSTTPYMQNLNNFNIPGCNTGKESRLYGFNDTDYILNNPSHPLTFRNGPNFYVQNIVSGDSPEVGAGLTEDESNGHAVSVRPSPTDTTPPILNLPPNQIIHAPSNDPVIVNYPQPTATDDLAVDEDSLKCNPANGSSFMIGNTTVTCSVADVAGLVTSGTFVVTVIPPNGPQWIPWAITIAIVIIITPIGVWVARREHHRHH